MEQKRFLLFILLSFLILYLWQDIMPKKDAPITQTTSEQEVRQIPENKETLPSEILPQKTMPETINTLESESLIADFSTTGGALKSVYIKEYDTTLPVTNFFILKELEDQPFKLVFYDSKKIEYIFENENFKVIKQYELQENEYLINAKIDIQNKTMSKQDYNINAFILDSSLDNIPKKDEKDKGLMEYVVNTKENIIRKNNAYKFSPNEEKNSAQPINWIGFRNRYYCAIVKPIEENNGFILNPLSSDKMLFTVKMKSQPGNFYQYSSVIFIGPEKINLLKNYNLGFDQIRKYYRLGLFDVIAKFIAEIMNLLHKIIPNWGICIILISFLIYFSMYPLTLRSMSSMKKMQSLQPKMAELREKHKNNPQKMNVEIMELYKKHNVNPFGGCLPMLLQMPVFIGLYQVLWRSVEFKGAKFLWIQDLSGPDRLFILPVSLPIIGNEINLLPLIMVVVMIIQQKLSSKNMIATDPQQIAQQKMMATFFPLFLGFIFYKFSSGLTLYFTMFYLFSTFTQWKISRTAS